MNIFLNWYRSFLSNVIEAEKGVTPHRSGWRLILMFSCEDLPKRLTLPYLYLGCEKDMTAPPQLVQMQNEHCDQLTYKSFPAGHWLLEEDPNAALKAILEWLPSLGA
jgi:pimeloyl-ACP methyl ester carboxylesterase